MKKKKNKKLGITIAIFVFLAILFFAYETWVGITDMMLNNECAPTVYSEKVIWMPIIKLIVLIFIALWLITAVWRF